MQPETKCSWHLEEACFSYRFQREPGPCGPFISGPSLCNRDKRFLKWFPAPCFMKLSWFSLGKLGSTGLPFSPRGLLQVQLSVDSGDSQHVYPDTKEILQGCGHPGHMLFDIYSSFFFPEVCPFPRTLHLPRLTLCCSSSSQRPQAGPRDASGIQHRVTDATST